MDDESAGKESRDATSDEPMFPAPSRPCGECPYRVSNVDRPVPEGIGESPYSRSHRAVAYDSVRRGLVTICHESDADRDRFPLGGDPRWAAAGFVSVPEGTTPRECGGSVAAAMRELRLLKEAGSFAEYSRRRPKGLTVEAAKWWVARLAGEDVGAPRFRRPKVPEDEIIDVAGDPEMSHHEVRRPHLLRALGPLLADARAALAEDAPR